MKTLATLLTVVVAVSMVCTEDQDDFDFDDVEDYDEAMLAELDCLNKSVADQCDLQVLFGAPVGNVTCDALVPTPKVYGMFAQPTLTGPKIANGTKVLIMMFDPDAAIGHNEDVGFVHWLALATVSATKNLTITTTIMNYFEPEPPQTDEAHRYQFFVFEYSGTPDKVKGGRQRGNSLCNFINGNNFTQPLGAFQYRYSSYWPTK